MKLAHQIAIALLVLTAVTSIYGAYHFITDPSGHSLGYSIQEIKGTPFKNYLIPGWLLLIFMGIGSVIACELTMEREKKYTHYIMIQGVICVTWVIVQIIMIQQFSGLQIAFLVIGIALSLIGRMIKDQDHRYRRVAL